MPRPAGSRSRWRAGEWERREGAALPWARCARRSARTVEGGPLPPSARVSPRAGEADGPQPPFRSALPPSATHLAREIAPAFGAGPVQRTGPRSGSESSLPRRSFCPAARRILRPRRRGVKSWLASACDCACCEAPRSCARRTRRHDERRDAHRRCAGRVPSASSSPAVALRRRAPASQGPAPRTRRRRSTPCRAPGPAPAGSPTRSPRRRGC